MAVHGVIRMVTSDAARRWWEYELKFTDGQLVHLLPLDQARYDIDGAARTAPQRQETP